MLARVRNRVYGPARTAQTEKMASEQERVSLALVVHQVLSDARLSAWYDRLALVLMNHFNESPEQKESKCREATQTCIDGLLDEDTHFSKSSI